MLGCTRDFHLQTAPHLLEGVNPLWVLMQDYTRIKSGGCSSLPHVNPTFKLSELFSWATQWVEITLHESLWQENLALRYWFANIYASFNHLSILVNSLGLFIFLLILFISSLFSQWIIEFAQTKDGYLNVFSSKIYLIYFCIISVVFYA